MEESFTWDLDLVACFLLDAGGMPLSGCGKDRGQKTRYIRILQTMVSGFPFVLGLGTGMQDPCVSVAFGALKGSVPVRLLDRETGNWLFQNGPQMRRTRLSALRTACCMATCILRPNPRYPTLWVTDF